MPREKVLVVEDDRIIQLDICDRLEEFGYVIAGVAASGSEAIQMAAETSPNLILMDIKLEGEIDGVQTALQIRLRQNMPIIYLTAFTDIRTLGRASGTEPYFYIVKPVKPKELKAMIANALHTETKVV